MIVRAAVIVSADEAAALGPVLDRWAEEHRRAGRGRLPVELVRVLAEISAIGRARRAEIGRPSDPGSLQRATGAGAGIGIGSTSTGSPPAMLCVTVAAQRLGLSPRTVRARCASGLLPARRVGRAWLVEVS